MKVSELINEGVQRIRRRYVECLDTQAASVPFNSTDEADSMFERPPDRFLNPYLPDGEGTEIELFVLPKPEARVQQRIARIREELKNERKTEGV